MCSIVQRLRLRMPSEEQHCSTQHCHKQRGHQCRGFCTRKNLCCHVNLLPVTPDGCCFFRTAGLLARGSLRPSAFPAQGPVALWKATLRIQSRGRLGLGVPDWSTHSPFSFQSGRFALIEHLARPCARSCVRASSTKATPERPLLPSSGAGRAKGFEWSAIWSRLAFSMPQTKPARSTKGVKRRCDIH